MYRVKKFRPTPKMLQTAVIVLGIALILFAVLKALLKFDLGTKVEGDITTFITFGALFIFLWSRQIRKEDEAAAAAAEKERLEAENARLAEDAEVTAVAGDDGEASAGDVETAEKGDKKED